jgi:hypothetical protein
MNYQPIAAKLLPIYCIIKAALFIGSSAFLMGKFIQSSRNPLNPSKVFEKATHY